MLAVMNVRYIVVHNDFDPLFTPVSIGELKTDLDNAAGVSLVATFGQIAIYENSFWKPSEVYASSNVISIPEAGGNTVADLDNAMTVASNNAFSVGHSALIISNQNAPGGMQVQSITSFDPIDVNLQASDGANNPFSWSSLGTDDYAARYYGSWQGVIGNNNSYMLVSPSYGSDWSAINSTLVYLTTGSDPLTITSILADGNVVSDVVGVWCKTGYLEMNNTEVYPMVIPANQDAIIQINQKISNLTLVLAPPSFTIPQKETSNAEISYKEINPTQYSVSVNASAPFLLVFSEPYNANWVAFIDGKQAPVDLHFMANALANGWYINKTGSYTVTLEFSSQNLFYIGSAVSLTTMVLMAAYLVRNKVKALRMRLKI